MANTVRKQWSMRIASAQVRDINLLTMLITLHPCSAVIAAVEYGTKQGGLHMHIQMDLVTPCQRQTISATARKIYDDAPAGADGISVTDPNGSTNTWEKGLKYVCKGPNRDEPPEILINRGTDCDPKELQRLYYAFQDGSLRGRKASGKGKSLSMYDELNDVTAKCQTGEEAMNLMVDWYESVKRHVQWNAFQDVVRKIVVERDGTGAAKRSLKEQLHEKIYGSNSFR